MAKLKIILFIAIFCKLSLFSASFFTEKRYIYALDKTVVLKGALIIDENSTIIKYSKPTKKNLTLTGKTLLIEDFDAKSTQIVDLSKRMDMSLYFSFIKAAYLKDLSALKSYFDITAKGGVYYLSPKRQVNKIIDKVEIKTESDEIKKLLIYFSNQDIIEIDTL